MTVLDNRLRVFIIIIRPLLYYIVLVILNKSF
jgi:hypothetical protein